MVYSSHCKSESLIELSRAFVNIILHKWINTIKELTVARSHRSSGRNNEGKITVRGRGGGHKKRARLIDFHRWNAGRQEVVRIEYDPNRSGHIALLKHLETGIYRIF